MAKTIEAEKLIHVKTATQMLCCTTMHVYNLVRDGRIEAVRVGPRGMRIKKASVDQFIQENTIAPEDFYA